MDGIEFCVDIFNVNVCQPMYEHKIESVATTLTDDEAYELYRRVCYESDYGDRFSTTNIAGWSYKEDRHDSSGLKKSAIAILDQLKAWQNKNSDWQFKLEAARARWKEANRLAYEQSKKNDAAKKAREVRVKKFFNVVALYTKYPLSLVLGIISIYILYGLALVGLWLLECSGDIANFFVSAFNWVIGLMVNHGLMALGVIAGIAGLVVLIALSVKLLSKCTLFHTGRQGPVSKFFSKFGNGVYEFIDFFVTYAKAAKQNYCPRINWK